MARYGAIRCAAFALLAIHGLWGHQKSWPRLCFCIVTGAFFILWPFLVCCYRKRNALSVKTPSAKNLQREFYSLIYFRNAIFATFTISLITRICCIVQPFSNSSISFLEGSAPLCPSESKSSVRTFKLSAMATKTGRLSLVFPVSMWLICVTETPIRSANCSCEMPCAFLYFRIFCPIK